MNRHDQTGTSADPVQLHGHDYAQRFERMHGRRRLMQLLPLMDLRAQQDVLDVGCGNGLMAVEVHRDVRSYTGIDFSQPFIELATARAVRLGAGNVRFEHSTIEDFCARHPERFDAAFAFDLSEHVHDEFWVAMLVAIRRALKPSGSLYLHTPNADFILERMKRRNFLIRQSPEHVAVRTMAENIRLLETAGFGIETVHYVRHYNSLRFLHPLSQLPIVGGMFRARIFIAARRAP